MDLQKLLSKYLTEEGKVEEFLKEMKEAGIYTAKEENLDIRFKKLQDDFNAKDLEHQEATKLIDELKKSSKGNEDIQTKLSVYESEIAQLREENAEIKTKSALIFALQDAKVTNVDYIAYKIEQDLKANDKKLELDENGHIKGINDYIEAQKKAEPSFFATETQKEVDVKELGKAQDEASPEPENLLDALRERYNPKTDI